MDIALIESAQCLVDEDVNLKELPDSKQKQEFLQLAKDALNDKLNGLQKARLEYLSNHMKELWDSYKEREEKIKIRQQKEKEREKREKIYKQLRKKTPKGQPILKNLARIQLYQVQDMIAKESKQ